MIENSVDAARIETNQLSYDLQPCDIAPAIRDGVETLMPSARAAGVELTTGYDASLPAVRADTVRISQLVNNLVANAIKFTDPGGTITVTTLNDTENGRVVLSVSDTGRGISPQFVDKIFERFAQTRVEDSEFHQGMGIGLYLCADIANKHEGELSVDSEPTKGSTFTLTLPVAASSELSASTTAA